MNTNNMLGSKRFREEFINRMCNGNKPSQKDTIFIKFSNQLPKVTINEESYKTPDKNQKLKNLVSAQFYNHQINENSSDPLEELTKEFRKEEEIQENNLFLSGTKRPSINDKDEYDEILVPQTPIKNQNAYDDSTAKRCLMKMEEDFERIEACKKNLNLLFDQFIKN